MPSSNDDGRLEAEALAGSRDVGVAVADVARAELVAHLGLDLDAELSREHLGDLRAPSSSARADVERPPSAAPGSSADTTAPTMSETWTKSRLCRPSSKITGGRPFSRREEKIAATPVYGFESACRGP